MKPRVVVTTPEADDDARHIDRWWVEHRRAAPNLFLEELQDALSLLALEPGVGVRYAQRAIPGLRRYFVYTDDLVVIVALWGATRRAAPRFGPRAASAKRAHVVPGASVVPGFVNANAQTVIRATGLPGTDHNQQVYELSCGVCGAHYGSNGSDVFQRKCPHCGGGADGLPLG